MDSQLLKALSASMFSPDIIYIHVALYGDGKKREVYEDDLQVIGVVLIITALLGEWKI